MTGENVFDIIASRKQTAWIKGCPVRVTEVKMCSDRNTGEIFLVLILKSCTERRINSFDAVITYYSARKEKIGESCVSDLSPEYNTIKSELSDFAYAEVTIKEVRFADESSWVNENNSIGETPVEQSIIWQTDPLYKVIKKVTAGNVDAKYYPDEIDGGWRCACGNINTEDSSTCANCKCTRAWLREVFDKEYLESQMSVVESGKKPETVKKIKKKQVEKLVSDKTKMILIFSGALIAVILIVLSIVYFIPQIRYNAAHKHATLGEYDKAIEIFEDLNKFKNSSELVQRFTYEKYVNLTGVKDLYITDSISEPWFKVSETGVLEFIDTKYKGEWNHFDIPDVVDGIVVKELGKSFFLNASSLVSITLPDTLIVIGEQAFMNCSALEKIEFGTRIIEIQPRAFANCTSLTEITIPDSVSVFGQRMFNNCTSLKTVTLGEGISKIQAFTFSNCGSLKTLCLCSPISEIGESAFELCDELSEIICEFSKSDWTDPEIKNGNESFRNAKVIYN